ncbi:glycerol-3-phosphate 1-O-acyltransferase PlsY [Rhizobium sp. HT1-10]|uniref:glycerol-3-phosphate 1-O-acyltransferase PlsY n=1 Tax=Rhizobium sp. HT1-10 TaxID=3111638 RepID=UPI003C1F48CD
MNWQITLPFALAALAVGYLLGSIPFGLVLTRMAGLGDVRSIGSGSIGATNVLRTGNKKLAVATMLLDALKGTVAVLVCGHLFGAEAGLLAGFAAFIGHIFPVWIGFRGGKGVATYIGILLALAPAMVLLFAIVWLAFAFLTRYSSLSALVATLVIPVALWILGPEKIAAAMTLMSLICWWKHKANIARLTAGTESKIGSKG